jgi:hypothetical protein
LSWRGAAITLELMSLKLGKILPQIFEVLFWTPGTLDDVFTHNASEKFTFKQSTSTYKCEIVFIVQSTKEFIESLLEKLILLLCHSFFAGREIMFLKKN